VTPIPPRMTRSQAVRVDVESSKPQKTIENEVILETPPKKKCSKTLDERKIVHELSIEHKKLHGETKIVNIIEEIQSGSLPTNESV
jgi:hypothetical protein